MQSTQLWLPERNGAWCLRSLTLGSYFVFLYSYQVEEINFHLPDALHGTSDLFGGHVESVEVPSGNLEWIKKKVQDFIIPIFIQNFDIYSRSDR